MDIQALQTRLRDFAAERRWQLFHTPKNLAMALMVDAAELLAHFQWLTPAESLRVADDAAQRHRIGEGIADVLLYLLQLADLTRVDIDAAVQAKLLHNARKHPLPQNRATPDEPAPALPARDALHVLLDFENVQPDDDQVRVLVPQVARLWVFHGPHQRQVAERFRSFGQQLTTVPISKTGKNALDFHLSFYMGYIAARNPYARFVVLANDKGYEPMLEHARVLGFDVQAIGMARAAKAVATKPVVRKAPVARKTAIRKTAPKPASEPAPKAATTAPGKTKASKSATRKTAPTKKAATSAPKSAPRRKAAAAPAAKAKALPPTASKPDDGLLLRIEDGLRKLGAKRPTRLARLRGVLKSFIGASASEDAVTKALGGLIAASVVDVGPAGDVVYPQLDASG